MCEIEFTAVGPEFLVNYGIHLGELWDILEY